jgi:hypothetical protein
MIEPRMMILFNYVESKQKFLSRFGWTTWEEYLRLEKERIEKSPGRVVEIRRNRIKPSQMTIFVNKVA